MIQTPHISGKNYKNGLYNLNNNNKIILDLFQFFFKS